MIIASNHKSNWDPPLLATTITLVRRPYVLAKAELFRYSFLGQFIEMLGGIKLRRGRADRDGLRNALALLARGDLLVVFPEGTRKRENRLERFLPGVGFLSLKAGVPVVPAYISEFGSFPGLGQRVDIFFGPAVAPAGTSEEMAAKVLEAVRKLSQ